MIVADTNVWSEPLRSRPSASVLHWLADHEAELAMTTVTVSELLYGALRLTPGRRRTALLESIDRLVRDSGDRLLTFDEEAARSAADLRIARERQGRPTSTEDLMIAAIAQVHSASVATRNVADFEGFDVDVVNPWES